MVSSVSTVDYPPRRLDLQKDTGWRCWVYKNDQQVLVRFGSKILFYEHFSNGFTRFGCMPHTRLIFHIAAVYIIAFIKYCGKVCKRYNLRLKRKLIQEEIQMSKRSTIRKFVRNFMI
jgi:hypothetical protein